MQMSRKNQLRHNKKGGKNLNSEKVAYPLTDLS